MRIPIIKQKVFKSKKWQPNTAKKASKLKKLKKYKKTKNITWNKNQTKCLWWAVVKPSEFYTFSIFCYINSRNCFTSAFLSLIWIQSSWIENERCLLFSIVWLISLDRSLILDWSCFSISLVFYSIECLILPKVIAKS